MVTMIDNSNREGAECCALCVKEWCEDYKNHDNESYENWKEAERINNENRETFMENSERIRVELLSIPRVRRFGRNSRTRKPNHKEPPTGRKPPQQTIEHLRNDLEASDDLLQSTTDP